MEILKNYQCYEARKCDAKEYYRKIGRIWYPILNDYIVFNAMGFRYAQKIIANPKAVFATEKRIMAPLASEAEFFACTNRIDGNEITVIIRRVNMGQKHFFSIFAK